MEKFDVIVIGAGPAGAVASSYLNKQGNSVLVLEKQKFPRFVIGESLLPHCMDHLKEAGLLDAVEPANFQKKTGAAFHRGPDRCEFLFTEQYTEGWDWTWQVKRAEFDHIIITEAQNQGVIVRFESTVEEVTCGNVQKVTYADSAGDRFEVEGKFIIDASGYGRVLPRLFDLNVPSEFPPRGSVFSHFEDINRTKEAGNNIFVHSFNNNEAWTWAIPFSDGTTSVGVVGTEQLINEFAADNGKEFKQFIQTFPELKGRFKGAALKFEPRRIQGYSAAVSKMYGDGFVLCGNSTEFLDPIFSSGVTLATASGLQAAKLVHHTLSGNDVDWKVEYEDYLRMGVDVFRSYVAAWYNGDLQTIFFADSIQPEFKNQICSVLAGYVWDKSNPFITKHNTLLATLAKVIKLSERV